MGLDHFQATDYSRNYNEKAAAGTAKLSNEATHFMSSRQVHEVNNHPTAPHVYNFKGPENPRVPPIDSTKRNNHDVLNLPPLSFSETPRNNFEQKKTTQEGSHNTDAALQELNKTENSRQKEDSYIPHVEIFDNSRNKTIDNAKEQVDVSSETTKHASDTTRTAAVREAWAGFGLFQADASAPYETIQQKYDGTYRMGRYGFNAEQLSDSLNSFLASGEHNRTSKLSEAYKEKLRDPKFVNELKALSSDLKTGDISKEQMKEMLPKEMQDCLANELVHQLQGKLGDKPGLLVAALATGKSAGHIEGNFATSLMAQKLEESGNKLFENALAKKPDTSDFKKTYAEDEVVPVSQRRPLIEQALRLAGVSPTESNITAINQMVQAESSWEPTALNDWDSNAKAGHPSQGLIQTIPSTFEKYAIDGYDKDITDPISNLVAGIRYAIDRYGSISQVPGVVAVSNGNDYVGF